MVVICIKYCYVLLINLFYIPDPPFLLHAILETALTHLRMWCNYIFFLGNYGRWLKHVCFVYIRFNQEQVKHRTNPDILWHIRNTIRKQNYAYDKQYWNWITHKHEYMHISHSSCSTSCTRRVNLVTNPVISHESGKDW